MRNRARNGLLLALALVALAGAKVSFALHRFTPPLVQVTSMTGGEIGKLITQFPDQWVFESNGDPVANGSTGWQIFVFDLLQRDFAGQPGLSQITFGPHNARNPAISRNGQYVNFGVAFEADGDLCADPLNACDALSSPTTGRQIFVYSTADGLIRQVTKGPGDCQNPSLSGNSEWLVFESAADLLGDGTVGNVSEVYHAHLTKLSPDCTQLPCPNNPNLAEQDPALKRLTVGGGTHPVLNFNGKVAAFESRGDLAHGGAHPGTQQIYALTNVIATNGVLTQLTNGTTDARVPSINQNGTRIAFEWDQMGPSGLVSQIYWAKTRPKRPTLITQVTNGPLPSQGPSLAVNGRRLTFASAADLLGRGTGSNMQIFQYYIPRRALVQFTQAPNGAQTGQSTVFALFGFVSADDLRQNGNVTPQVFVGNPTRNAPPDFKTPFPGIPTPLPTPGTPASVSISILDKVQDNGDGTVTSIIPATVLDGYMNPVPDGLSVTFTFTPADGSITMTNGTTNGSPSCDIASFEAATGLHIGQQAGVAYGCLVYPVAAIGESKVLNASIEGPEGPIVDQRGYVLPAP
jgi:Tol biopolymer transport system component